ncbi:MAG: hypothetical protein ABJA93_06140 [Sporichthyaceae bacterium]
MDQPDLLEDGRSHARGLRIPPAVWRAGWPLAAIAVVAWVVMSLGSDAPSPLHPPVSSVDVPAVDQAARSDIQAALFARSQRNAHIRAAPARYREAASQASAMRDGRTPGNFFLALAYDKTLYGELLVQSVAMTFVEIGPVQWKRVEFDRYAEPPYRDISKPLDSFLAVDSALHRGHNPGFSAGAFGPARLLGLDVAEAQSVAAIYDTLDGGGVRDGLPR